MQLRPGRHLPRRPLSPETLPGTRVGFAWQPTMERPARPGQVAISRRRSRNRRHAALRPAPRRLAGPRPQWISGPNRSPVLSRRSSRISPRRSPLRSSLRATASATSGELCPPDSIHRRSASNRSGVRFSFEEGHRFIDSDGLWGGALLAGAFFGRGFFRRIWKPLFRRSPPATNREEGRHASKYRPRAVRS